MVNILFWLSLVLIVGDWAAVALKKPQFRWYTKPGAMLAMILWFTLAGKWSGPLAAIGLGLLFSLLGDIILLLPLRYFTAGMAAFFLAYLFYIAGFNQQPLSIGWETTLPVLAVAGGLSYLNKRVRNGLARRGGETFIVQFVLFSVILSLMWFSALTTLFRPGWLASSAMMVSLGGSLFFLSDSLLVYHRFVTRVRQGDLLVTITYHLAQVLIVAATLDQFVI
jgi:uncharacterized membrane protein YhhN